MRTATDLHGALLRDGHATVISVGPVSGDTCGPGNVLLGFTEDATAPQREAAEAYVVAFDWSDEAQAAWDNVAARDDARTLTTDPRAGAKSNRAFALVALDEGNLTREWITAFKAAVAASTSLADLKTRVAALPTMPPRTEAQLKAAVNAKIEVGSADT